jgi:tRNA nucleotidyltransferase/poly(A) polymerase
MSDAPALEHPCPAGLRAVAARLRAAGFETWLVGESVHACLLGEPPREWTMTTSASAEQIIACLAEAVPTRPRGAAFLVPTASGPLDLCPLVRGPSIEDDLAARGFGLLAMAASPENGQLIDPHGGRGDVLARRLRTVGPPESALAAAPLRAVQAARLVACHDYALDAELRGALSALPRQSLSGLPAMALRREMRWLLLGPHAGAGLRALRETGIEEQIASGTRADTAEIIDALPRDLELRLAAWLRGAGGARTLRKLRFDRDRSQRVLRLLQAHPIEAGVDPRRRSALRRLQTRLGEADRRALFLLRRLELERGAASPESKARALTALQDLEQAIARDEEEREQARDVPEPVLKGEAVMRLLDWPPGPGVGRALAHLRACVAADPSCNSEEALGERLRAWAADQSPG